MNRHWLVAVAVLASLPVGVSAQLPGRDEGLGPRIRATPFFGFSPGFNSKGVASVVSFNNPDPTPFPYSFDLGSGPISGVNLEVRAWDRFSVIAAGAWSSRGSTVFHTDDGDIGDDGSDLWLAKLGAAMRLREVEPDMQLRRLNASIFIAPTLVREVPTVTAFSAGNFVNAVNNWGMNFGLEAEMPLANELLAFTFALEDNVIFWNENAQARRLQPRFQEVFGVEAVGLTDSDHSHLWVARLGVSFRFGR